MRKYSDLDIHSQVQIQEKRERERERPGFPESDDLLKRFAFQIAPLQIFCLAHALQHLLI